MAEEYHTCTKCGESKPHNRTYFPPHKEGRNGLYAQCRVCRCAYLNAYNAARRARSREEGKPPCSAPGVERVCSRCKVNHPLSAQHFKPNPLQREGFSTWCIACEKAYYSQHARDTAAHRNAARAQRRRDNPEKTKADSKRYYAMYKEQRMAAYRVWRERNREHLREWERARTALFKRLMTVADAAAFIGVQETTVRAAIRQQRVTGLYRKHKWWVFRDEVQAWKEKREKGPQVKPVFSLDAAKEGGGSFHEWIADPNALNPLQAVMMRDTVETVLSWVAAELAEEEQQVLLSYADKDFDEKEVAATLNKPLRTVRSIIRNVQQRAVQTFGQDMQAA